jgi:phospholipid/cholesterol/gamma-HCH transport system substrate-binding protein
VDPHHPLKRYSREAVGGLVILAVALFLAAASQAGRVQQWLNPGVTVRVLMPDEGLYGLSRGADVEVLGTVAGRVREIVIESGDNMHALVTLRREVFVFVRQDSRAFIKRRFGVAGDAYLEITRGTGAALDDEFPVLTGSGERIPTQTVEQLIGEVRRRALPILDQAEAAIGALAQVAGVVNDGQQDIREFLQTLNRVSQRIEQGEGSIGRLVSDDTLVRKLEEVLERTRVAMAGLEPILVEMQAVARNAAAMSENLGEQADAIPEVSRRAMAVLGSLQAVMDDVRKTTPELPGLTRNVARATEELPRLIGQTEQALQELETLIRQLRGSWILGGSRPPAEPDPQRVSPLRVTP